MTRIVKGDLIDDLASSVAGLTKKDAAGLIDMLLSRITAAVGNGHEVAFKGFGTFRPSHRAERIGRNPRTGAELLIPASKSMAFRAAKAKAQG